MNACGPADTESRCSISAAASVMPTEKAPASAAISEPPWKKGYARKLSTVADPNPATAPNAGERPSPRA